MRKKLMFVALPLGVLAVAVAAFHLGHGFLKQCGTEFPYVCPAPKSSAAGPNGRMKTPATPGTGAHNIAAVGFVRGRSLYSVKNKYAGFVSKVNFYTGSRVKKGDVILEYDDLPLRRSIADLEHRVAEQESVLASRKLSLEQTLLDPLPSEYRNLHLKRKIAQENLDRLAHEFEVYRKLHGSSIISDLAYREKREEYKTSETELRKMDNDMAILKKGLSSLYIKRAEANVHEAEVKLNDLREELELLREERKYYRIAAPIDGYCVTNSDTVGGYDPVGTSAAEVYRDDRKLVYAYFPESAIRFIKEGDTLRFLSNQYPDDKQGFELLVYEIKKNRYDYGEESFFLVKCKVVKEPHPLRINSIGTVTPMPPQE